MGKGTYRKPSAKGLVGLKEGTSEERGDYGRRKTPSTKYLKKTVRIGLRGGHIHAPSG